MKVSLNWIKEFTDVNLPVDELVEKIGARLGGVEEVIDVGKKYDGIAVVKVVSCEPHPNADKLKICLIDEGGFYYDVERNADHLIRVVCGAPNVRAGMLAVWIPPGYTVPSTVDKDPLVLEAREIRGQMSNGMLASGKELDINDDHSGILEVDIDTQPGVPFDELYKLDDHIIDIENKMFTHRPDLFGQLGVAREIAGIQQQAFTSPDWYTTPQNPLLRGQSSENSENENSLPLKVNNEIPDLCPRFMAVALSGVTIKPSPLWLQSSLSRLGVRPINNVVDITNYMMLLTAQPLHAYDYDKVVASSERQVASIVVRHPQPGEKLKLLNGKEIEPRAEAILIATDKEAIGLAGVMGGGNTEVDEHTTSIILECATFDMYSIRRTSMEHGIFTDAVTRFTKGQSPLQTDRVLAKSVEMLQAFAGATVASAVVDNKHVSDKVFPSETLVHDPIMVAVDFINQRLGLSLGIDEVIKLLTNVEFEVDKVLDELEIQPPFWRTDIEIPEDIVEEIGRLYGYDHLPLTLPRRSIKPAAKNPMTELKDAIRSTLAKAGANELLTYSFVHGNLLDKVGQDRAQAFQIANALSPELQYYRLSLTPSLLDKVHANVKAGYDEFALFEIGTSHIKTEQDQEGLPREFHRVALVYAANDKTATASAGSPYYQAQKFAMYLLNDLGVSEFKLEPYNMDLSDNLLAASRVAPFSVTRRSAILATVHGLDNVTLGIIGEFTAEVKKNLKLPKCSAGFELEIDILPELLKETSANNYSPLPKFPKVEQDICLKVSADMPYQKLSDFVQEKVAELKPEHTRASLSPVDIYRRDDDQTHKQITLRLSIASFEKTMTDPEVAKLLDEVAAATRVELSAERI